MIRRSKMQLVISCALGLSALGWVGCRQGRGDRCQVNDDCGSGLICNKATNTCQATSGGGDIDATVPDAPPDARADAPVSAPK